MRVGNENHGRKVKVFPQPGQRPRRIPIHVVLIVRLLAAASMADDRIALTNRASLAK